MGKGVITDVKRVPPRASRSNVLSRLPGVAVTTQVVGAAGVDTDEQDVANFFAVAGTDKIPAHPAQPDRGQRQHRQGKTRMTARQRPAEPCRTGQATA